MRNLWLRESDRQPEMTVVRNEFEIGENNPIEALDKEIGAAAYMAHPYHHSTIGWRSDIEKVSIEKLKRILRHLLLAGQRNCHRDRRLRARRGPRLMSANTTEPIRRPLPPFPRSTPRSPPRPVPAA